MNRRSLLALAVLLAALAGACGKESERCVPPPCPAYACVKLFFLTVTDAATSMPLDDASATGDVPCSTQVSGVDCDASAPGVYHLTISAPGHASSQVAVTVDSGAAPTACSCGGCATFEPRSVALSPL